MITLDPKQTEVPGTPGSRRAPRAAWQRWGLGLLIAALLYTVGGFWALPMIVRTVAVSQLRQALDREVAIAKVRFNPYTFTVEIHGLAIEDPDGLLLAGWDRVRVDFQFTSVFHGPWRLKEITVDQPHARVQINADASFNFSDLLEKYAATEEPSEPKESGPLPRVRIDALRIAGATIDFTDLTPSSPFRRQLGPVDLSVPGFSTLPGHTNTLALRATTDAGEQFAWESQFWLDPLRLTGSLRLEGLAFTNYTALYQDFLQVQVRGGIVQVSARHELQFDSEHPVARVTDNQFSLTDLRVGLPGAVTNLVELDQLTVDIPLLDVWERQVTVQHVLIDGIRIAARRLAGEQLDLVEVAQPPPTAGAAPGSAQLIAEAFTSAFALFGGSTNAAVAVIHDVVLTNTALALIDEVPAHPAHVRITDLAVRVRDLSNRPEAAPSASVSLRWQTNGTVNLNAAATLNPPAVEFDVDLNDLDMGVLDAYLAGQLNVSLLDSRFVLSGSGRFEAPPGQEPTGQFLGRLALESLHTAHSLEDHDLLKFEAFRVEGIAANLHPLDVAIDRMELVAPELWAILNADGTLNFFTAANLDQPLIGAPAASSEPADATSPVTGQSVDPTPITAVEVVPAATDPGVVPPVPVHIGRFVLSHATVSLLDRMAQPPVPLTITNLNGELRHLSSTNLQYGDFGFEGRIRSGGTFAIEGELRPLESADTTRARITLSEIELTPGSPYTARFLGYRLDAGKVTTDLNYQIKGGQLQATNHIILDRFTLGARVDSPDALNVPIRLGLAILQDRQGRIDLSIPVSGSLDDPQFSLAGVIRGAFANVFTKLFTSPFSMLGSMFGGGGGDDEDLQELRFQPGTAQLERSSESRLQKLEEILYQRPALQLVIRGTADPGADNTLAWRRALLNEQLREAWQPTADADAWETNGTSVAATFTEEDYRAAVQRAYFSAMSTRDSTLEPPSEDRASADSFLHQAEPVVESAAPSTDTDLRRPPQRGVRGGQLLLQNRRLAAASPSTAIAETSSADPSVEAQVAADPPPPSFEQMEQRLLDDLAPTAADWQRLASERADRIREALLQPGRVEPERLLVPELEGPVPSGTKVRLELE
jgi:hypothetical protein